MVYILLDYNTSDFILIIMTSNDNIWISERINLPWTLGLNGLSIIGAPVFSCIAPKGEILDGTAAVDGLTTCTTVEEEDMVEDALDALDEVSESRLISGSPSPKLFSKALSSPNMASKSWSNVSSKFIKLQYILSVVLKYSASEIPIFNFKSQYIILFHQITYSGKNRGVDFPLLVWTFFAYAQESEKILDLRVKA